LREHAGADQTRRLRHIGRAKISVAHRCEALGYAARRDHVDRGSAAAAAIVDHGAVARLAAKAIAIAIAGGVAVAIARIAVSGIAIAIARIAVSGIAVSGIAVSGITITITRWIAIAVPGGLRHVRRALLGAATSASEQPESQQ
jgi:hypothetical protein